MTDGIKLFVYPVTDMARAKTLYSRLLGTEPYADAPYYAGFKVGDQEIGLDPMATNKVRPDPSATSRVMTSTRAFSRCSTPALR